MHCEISEQPLDAHAVETSVLGAAHGALVTFVGYVRGRSDDDRPVDGLHYEAHRELALAEMRRVGEEAERRFSPTCLAIAHRVGELSVGEAAVVVAAGAPHRELAFDACEFAIDELKKRVPIWKKERYTDGDARWRENA